MRRPHRTASAVAALALLLTAAGCGGGDDSGSASPAETKASQQAEGSPHDDADVTFAQEMVPHHRQAVAMTKLTEGHDLDPQVQDLVDGIATTQSGEIDRMTGWLKGWDEKVPAEDSDMRMQGMLTDDQLTELGDTADPAFQRLWLTRMIGHHRGAIPMAQTELDEGKNPAARALAREIIKTQKAELYEMGGLLGQ